MCFKISQGRKSHALMQAASQQTNLQDWFGVCVLGGAALSDHRLDI